MFHERSMNVPEDQNVQEASGKFRNESFAKLAVSGIVHVLFTSKFQVRIQLNDLSFVTELTGTLKYIFIAMCI